MLIILIILLCVLLLIEYSYFDKELCCPAFLFTAPMIICCCMAQAYSEKWRFELHINTFGVILIGTIAFFLGTVLTHRVKLMNIGNNINIESNSINARKYVIAMLVQIICYSWRTMCLKQYGASAGVGRDLSNILSYVNRTIKFTTNSTISYPAVLNVLIDVSEAIGLIISCLLAKELVQRKEERKNLVLLIINFVLAIVGSFLSGGRAEATKLIFALLGIFIILLFRKNNYTKKIPIKYIVYMIFGVFLAAIVFMVSMTFIGRGEVRLVGRYITNYVGAQIFNLDYYLNYALKHSEIFGEQTFHSLISFLGPKIGGSSYVAYKMDLPFVYNAGYDTGNVYTTFYPYYHDFGFVGVFVLSFIFGAISQIVYRYARKSSTENPINMGLIIYAYLIYVLVFSFFSDKFYSLFFSITMIKRVIYIYIVQLYFFSVTIRGRVITVKKPNIIRND